jgi:hypothetical protein
LEWDHPEQLQTIDQKDVDDRVRDIGQAVWISEFANRGFNTAKIISVYVTASGSSQPIKSAKEIKSVAPAASTSPSSTEGSSLITISNDQPTFVENIRLPCMSRDNDKYFLD